MRVSLSVLIVALAGCSLVATTGPGHAQPCTTSYAMPILDGVGAVVSGAAAALTIGCIAGGGCDHESSANAVAGTAAVVSVIYIVSTVVGRSRVSSCRDAAPANGAPPPA